MQRMRRGSHGAQRSDSWHPSTSPAAESPNSAPLQSKRNLSAWLVKLLGYAPPANLSVIGDLDFALGSMVNVRGKQLHL